MNMCVFLFNYAYSTTHWQNTRNDQYTLCMINLWLFQLIPFWKKSAVVKVCKWNQCVHDGRHLGLLKKTRVMNIQLYLYFYPVPKKSGIYVFGRKPECLWEKTTHRIARKAFFRCRDKSVHCGCIKRCDSGFKKLLLTWAKHLSLLVVSFLHACT